MSPLEPSCPTTEGPEYTKRTEAQEKDLKTVVINMIEVLKEEMNKCILNPGNKEPVEGNE